MELLACPNCNSTSVTDIAHQGKFKCDECDEISEHDEMETITTKSFQCVTCNHEFKSANGLAMHVAVEHRECSVCGDTFGSLDALDEHAIEEH